MTTNLPAWSRRCLLASAGVAAACASLLGIGNLAQPTHGCLLAERLRLPVTWGGLLAVAVLAGAGALLRRPRGTAVTVLLALPVVGLLTMFDRMLAPTRGHEFASPDGRWSVRLDDHGFQEVNYALVATEHRGLRSRYWQAGDLMWPGFHGTARVPRWTSPDTVEVVVGDTHRTWRMTPQGPVRVG